MAASRFATAALTLFVALLMLLAVGLVVIYSGIVDVAATKPHYTLTQWVLGTTMEHSVERRARQVSVPPNLSADPNAGAEYHKMCELCHGGPGKEPSEIGKGLRPRPPDLAKVAADAEIAELFWVIKNGIRMTGMPAFGITHPDEKLWKVASFVKRLPKMSDQEYWSLTKDHEKH